MYLVLTFGINKYAETKKKGWMYVYVCTFLFQSPMSSMRGGLESPVCFPISTGTGSNQFMSPMNSYNKLESTIPNHNTMHNGYNMQV